jgi:ParB-like chromosome segregation protein Spo0J
MAKRRRLTPAQYSANQYSGTPRPAPAAVPRTGLAAAPIAQVAGEAAATAALQEVAGELASARAEGRLVLRLALDSIETGYLLRDRIDMDAEALTQLTDSLRAHGQRAPIEVTDLGQGRYGLISGFRRIAALAQLRAESGDDRFGHVLALLRQPGTAGDAYVAMVEENEVRLGLSYYERARIAARATDLGVFETERQALQRLFASASRSRRSKIGSFLGVYRALDDALRFPAALPERLGLALAQHLEAVPDAAARLTALLADPPAQDAAEEQARLAAAIAPQAAPEGPPAPVPAPGQAAPPALPARPPVTPGARGPEGAGPLSGTAPPPPAAEELRPGVFLTVGGGWTKPILTLSGPGVGPEFRERLIHWLQHG